MRKSETLTQQGMKRLAINWQILEDWSSWSEGRLYCIRKKDSSLHPKIFIKNRNTEIHKKSSFQQHKLRYSIIWPQENWASVYRICTCRYQVIKIASQLVNSEEFTFPRPQT